MEALKKLMEKKKKEGSELSDNEKAAKMSVLKGLQDLASEMMGDHLKGLKKVTVASDSPEGLSHGLDMAKDKVAEMGDDQSPAYAENHSDSESDDMMSDEEDEESPEHEASESPEEEHIEDQIKELEDRLAALKSKKM